MLVLIRLLVWTAFPARPVPPGLSLSAGSQVDHPDRFGRVISHHRPAGPRRTGRDTAPSAEPLDLDLPSPAGHSRGTRPVSCGEPVAAPRPGANGPRTGHAPAVAGAPPVPDAGDPGADKLGDASNGHIMNFYLHS